jgi:hypothetical protein
MMKWMIEMKSVFGASYRLTVKSSPLHGDGVFAAEDIPWGHKILEYRGAIITDAEATRCPYVGTRACVMDASESRPSS